MGAASSPAKSANKTTPKARRPRYVEARVSSTRERFGTFSDDILLTEAEASEVAGLSKHTLKSWRLNDGDGPPSVRVGSTAVRYRAGALRQWLTSR
jgi:predicted DNA-binding transcriptional regulator AlpA